MNSFHVNRAKCQTNVVVGCGDVGSASCFPQLENSINGSLNGKVVFVDFE
jgi:hypothetical protein